ncbi:MAG: hypothetical protein GY952_02360 [Rhodobacteraceae bacterium]|nr:hypothetical protein [Paracoccaceae bacterium]
MSSFVDKHFIFLFDVKGGGKRLSYGKDSDDAWEVLGFRLSEEELDQTIKDKYTRIKQAELRKYVDDLR